MIHVGDIDEEFLKTLVKSNEKSLVLCSPGGCIYLMRAAIAHLRDCPIWIKATGLVASAAVPVLAFGAPGARVADPSARFMVHPISITDVHMSSHTFQVEAKEIELLQEEYWKTLAERTKKTAAWWKKQGAEVFYFGPKEALSWGLIDTIA